MAADKTQRPGQSWMDKMATEEPEAREAMKGVTSYAPHDGQTSDLNLHYADLLAGPDENHPDPAATPRKGDQS